MQPQTSITYSYDLNNNRTSVIAGTTDAISYSYDSLNRLINVIARSASDEAISFSYDALSRRITKDLPSGINTSYAYDSKSQLLAIGTVPELGLSLNYSYDKVGNRKTMTAQEGLHSFSYDNIYRLTSAIHPNIPQENYSYDPVGNRLGSVVDSANRLTDDGTYTYTYDNNGNLITKTNKSTNETTTFAYDAENRLVRVIASASEAIYSYDPLGRRIQKSVNGIITKYLYDNEDIIAEYDGNNNLTATFTHGPGIDEPLILDKQTNKYYYHTDALGSVTALSDSTGAIVQTYQYDSFGNIVSQQGSLTQPYTYTGREYDPETNLYYYRARYYDAKVGRFLQEDPIWDVNLYSYAGNNPLRYVDPYGDEITAGALAATWGVAAAEPTPVGEIIATGLTALALAAAVANAVKQAILLAKKAKVKGPKIEESEEISEDEAVDRVKQGDDVVAKSKEEAESIARKAGCGKDPVLDPPHDKDKHGKPKPGDWKPHYHPHGREGGHVFF